MKSDAEATLKLIMADVRAAREGAATICRRAQTLRLRATVTCRAAQILRYLAVHHVRGRRKGG